ncbi:hypothetical protein BJ917_3623 [Pseudomonas sp. WPR_5_2]|nr:hypothetical protein BJ917_3623 [Pseudomonas sp. WPR_5_2]
MRSPSLASQLPQNSMSDPNIVLNTAPCGSWLASDGAIRLNAFAETYLAHSITSPYGVCKSRSGISQMISLGGVCLNAGLLK